MNLTDLISRILPLQERVPEFTPTYDNPLGPLMTTALNVVAGIVVVIFVILFLIGLVRWINALGSDRRGGTNGPLTQVIMSIIGIFIVFSGAAWLNGWVAVFR